MADTLETLEIEVKHKAGGAVSEIDKLADSLLRLNRILTGVSIPKMESFAKALEKVSKANAKMQESMAAATQEVTAEPDTTPVREQKERVSIFERLGNAFSKVKGVLKGVTSGMSNLTKHSHKASGGVSKLLKSFGRIAFYRMIRKVISSITDAMKEGLQNAYAFSAGLGDTVDGRIAVALDRLSSASLKMKNQLGAAFGSLITAITPMLLQLINLVTKAADAVTQLFASLTGGTYLKAKNVNAKFAEDTSKGAKAAKEWKNQLMGFDEINRLEAPSDTGDSGSGATAIDPSQMFEVAQIDSKIKDFVDKIKEMIANGDWKGLGEMLGNAINSILPTDEQWNQWGQKLGYGLNGAISTLYYMLKTIDFKAIGSGIASFINGVLGQIDGKIWGATLVRIFTAALDFVISFLTTLDWGLVSKTLSDFFVGAFTELSTWLESYDWTEIGEVLWEKLKEFVAGINFSELASSFFTLLGEAFGALVGALDGFFGSLWEDLKTYFREHFIENGEDAYHGFLNGIMDLASDIYNWLKTNVVEPFVNGFKKLLGIHSPSTVMEELGVDTVEGFLGGFIQKWNEFKQIVDEKVSAMIDKFRELKDHLVNEFQTAWSSVWDNITGVIDRAKSTIRSAASSIKSALSGIISKARSALSSLSRVISRADSFEYDYSSDYSYGFYANGGFPDTGEVFIAREAGAEMVGSIGGRTAVATNADIVAAIEGGVYRAMASAMGSGSNNRQSVTSFSVNGREFIRAVYDDIRAVEREHGVTLVNNAV